MSKAKTLLLNVGEFELLRKVQEGGLSVLETETDKKDFLEKVKERHGESLYKRVKEVLEMEPPIDEGLMSQLMRDLYPDSETARVLKSLQQHQNHGK